MEEDECRERMEHDKRASLHLLFTIQLAMSRNTPDFSIGVLGQISTFFRQQEHIALDIGDEQTA